MSRSTSFRRGPQTGSGEARDAVADAQAALLAISSDAEIADAEARGYQEMRTAISRGLAVLENLTGNGEP